MVVALERLELPTRGLSAEPAARAVPTEDVEVDGPDVRLAVAPPDAFPADDAHPVLRRRPLASASGPTVGVMMSRMGRS